MTKKNIYPIILCGGSGTRLWPISRNSFPKQFLKICGEQSLLQDTVIRALSICQTTSDNLILLSLANFYADVESQLREINELSPHIISEPAAKNTAAAIAYAALYLKAHSGGESLMWILPSDHVIAQQDVLKQSFETALKSAQLGNLVTFGIMPTRPETGYGYINYDKAPISEDTYKVIEFFEKPNIELANQFIQSGNFLWNSGMFLFQADTILEELNLHAPDILAAAKNVFEHATNKNLPLLSDYQSIPSQPIDIAVMEKSKKVTVIPCDFGWSDVGSWESIWDISSKDENGNVSKGQVITYDTKDSLLFSLGERPIATASLERTIVVDTGDVVLVANMDNSQSIKFLLQELTKSGLAHLLEKF